MPMPAKAVLLVHGGAGVINRDSMSSEMETRYTTKLGDALIAGHKVLKAGGSSLDAVVAAEFVNQPLAASSGANAWSAPIAFFVENAVSVVRPADPVSTPKNAKVAISGSIQRHPLYRSAVSVSLEGLPAGFQAATVQVPADQTAFAVEVMVPEAAAAGEIANVSLKIDDGAGNRLLPPQPVRIVVQ